MYVNWHVTAAGESSSRSYLGELCVLCVRFSDSFRSCRFLVLFGMLFSARQLNLDLAEEVQASPLRDLHALLQLVSDDRVLEERRDENEVMLRVISDIG